MSRSCGVPNRHNFIVALSILGTAFTSSPTIALEPDERERAHGILLQGHDALFAKDYGRARKHYETYLGIARRLGNQRAEAFAYNSLAVVAQESGDLTAAIACNERALDIAQTHAYPEAERLSLAALGDINAHLGNHVDALRHWKGALTVEWPESRQLPPDDATRAPVLYNIGRICFETKQYADGVDYTRKALAAYRTLGDRAMEANTLGNLARLYRAQKRFDASLESFQAALELARAVGTVEEKIILLGDIGATYYALNDLEKAQVWSLKALNMREQHDCWNDAGVDFVTMGRLLKQSGRTGEAVVYLKKAINAFRLTADQPRLANALEDIGDTQQSAGKSENAAESWREAIAVWEALGAAGREGTAHARVANLFIQLKLWEKALVHAREAITLHGEAGLTEHEFTDLLALHDIYTGNGQQREAILLSDELEACVQRLPDAIERFRTIQRAAANEGDHHREAWALSSIAKVQLLHNDLLSAEQSYRAAIAVPGVDAVVKSICRNDLGLVYARLGLANRAKGVFEAALAELRKDLGAAAPVLEPMLLGNLGQANLDLGDLREARRLTQLAIQSAQRTSIVDYKYVAFGHATLGAICRQEKNYKAAIAHFEKALDLLTEGGDLVLRSSLELSIGECHINGRSPLLAGSFIERALARAERIGSSRLVWAANYWRGRLDEALGIPLSAQYYYGRAIGEIESRRANLARTDFRVGFFLNKVRVYEAMVRTLVQMYFQATTDAQRHKYAQRALLFSDAAKSRVLVEVMAQRARQKPMSIPALLLERVKVLRARITETQAQLRTAERTVADDTVTALTSSLAVDTRDLDLLITRIQQEFPDYAGVAYPLPRSLADIPLLEGEVLVEYEIDEEVTWAFVARREGGVRVYELPLTRSHLADMIRAVRRPMEAMAASDLRVGRLDFDAVLSHSLYRALLDPILQEIGPDERLLLIPDESLGLLPFAALVVRHPRMRQHEESGVASNDVVYLGDQRVLAYWPSAAALRVDRHWRRKAESHRMLVVANPVFNSVDKRARERQRQDGPGSDSGSERGRWRPLPDTADLAGRLLQQYAPNVTTLVGADASESRLRMERMETYGFAVVYATHGIGYHPVLGEPAIVLSDPLLTGELLKRTETQEGEDCTIDGYLTSSEIMKTYVPAEVVAVMSCSSGEGRRVTGEGIMSLARAFQVAGARSMLVSLWGVEGVSANILTEQFLKCIAEGASKREALLEARRKLQESNDYAHPFYWAPFILIGDGSRVAHHPQRQAGREASETRGAGREPVTPRNVFVGIMSAMLVVVLIAVTRQRRRSQR